MSTETIKAAYTPEEVAAMFGLKGPSIRKMLRQGRLPGYKFGGAWRIREADLQTLRNVQDEQALQGRGKHVKE